MSAQLKFDLGRKLFNPLYRAFLGGWAGSIVQSVSQKLLFIHRIWRPSSLIPFLSYFVKCRCNSSNSSESVIVFRAAFIVSGSFRLHQLRYTCICFFCLPHYFHDPFRCEWKKKGGKTSHPIEIIPETAGEIKVNCYCYTPPALLEGKIRVSRHFTTTLFFIILNVLYK